MATRRCTASNDILSLSNIGTVTAKKLAKIGIITKQDFLKQNPYVVFNELLMRVDPTLCRCALACIVGAVLNKPWHEITKVTAKEFEKLYPRHSWNAKKC